jgi:hypothetical protein
LLALGATVETVVQSIMGNPTFTSSASITFGSSAGLRWLCASPENQPSSAMFTQRRNLNESFGSPRSTTTSRVSEKNSFPARQ